MQADMFDRVVIVDVETVAIDDVTPYIDLPDLDHIKPAGNLKNPGLIAIDIAKRREALEEAHAYKVSRCALDWNLSRIAVLGVSDAEHKDMAKIIQDEGQERKDLEWFWSYVKNATIVGFNVRAFDLPMLIQRSRLLGVKAPSLDLGRYARDGRVVDLFDILTFHDARRDKAVMPQRLQVFAKRFGIPVNDDMTGKDTAEHIAAGDYDAVCAHCLSDLALTRALGERLGVLSPKAEMVL